MAKQTLDERRYNLKLANDVRSERHRDKERMKRGRKKVRPVLLAMEPPTAWKGAKIETLLLAVPTLGRKKVAKILNMTGTSPRATVGGLPLQARQRVYETLRERYPHAPIG